MGCQQTIALGDDGCEGVLVNKFENIGIIGFLIFLWQIHSCFFCEGKDISIVLQLFDHYIALLHFLRGNPAAWDSYSPEMLYPVP